MLKCESCETENVYKLRCVGGKWICGPCIPSSYVPGTYLIQNVTLDLGHSKMQIRKSEYDEIHRNVLIPGSTPGKRMMGRRMENGKIAERPIKPY